MPPLSRFPLDVSTEIFLRSDVLKLLEMSQLPMFHTLLTSERFWEGYCSGRGWGPWSEVRYHQYVKTYSWVATAIIRSVKLSTFDIVDYHFFRAFLPPPCFAELENIVIREGPSIALGNAATAGPSTSIAIGLRSRMCRIPFPSRFVMERELLGKRSDYTPRSVITTSGWNQAKMKQELMRARRTVNTNIDFETGMRLPADSDSVFLIRQPTLTVTGMVGTNVLVVPDEDEIDVKASKKELRKMYEQADAVKKQNRSGWRRK